MTKKNENLCNFAQRGLSKVFECKYPGNGRRRSHSNFFLYFVVTLAVLGAFSLCAPKTEATTYTWSTDKDLTSNWTVAFGDTLIIDPGVNVHLDTDVSIFVDGTLKAIGSANQPIIFSSLTPGTKWGSIMFNDTSTNNVLDFAVVDNATTGLLIDGTNAIINHVTITSSSLYAIHVKESSPVIANSTISTSGDLDIYVESQVTASPIALNTSFDKNSVIVAGTGSSLEVQWYLDVKVIDTLENPVQGAGVVVRNSSRDLVYSGFSDAQGLASWVICTEFINYSGNRVYHTPHNITSNKLGYGVGYAYPEPIIHQSSKIAVMIEDNLPPTTTIIVGTPRIEGIPLLVSPSTKLSFSAEDAGSGVATTEYKIDGDNWLHYLMPFNITSTKHHNLTYRSMDNYGNEEIERTLWIYVNSPPTIATSTIPDATANKLFQCQIDIDDIDEMDDFRFSLDTRPDGMLINASTGVISWLPGDDQVGTHKFTFNVTDGLSYFRKEFTIVVKPPIPAKDILMENLWLISVISIVVAIFGAMSATEYGKFALIKFLFLPLYTKLKKEKLLHQFTRGKIYGYILANQGEHYNSIKNALNLSNGSLTYHLSVLERENMIKSRIDGRYKRFYPKEAPISSLKSIDLLSMPQRYIYEIVKRTPGISQIEIADFMGESKQVVNYHVKALEGRGLLSIHFDGKYTRCYIKE